jgi:sporulation protein YqfC
MAKQNKFKHDLISAGESFADTFLLPKDMVVSATLFHMIGSSNLIIENFKGIISYTCDEILIKGNNIRYHVTGENLTIEYYSLDDMKISGQINQVKIIDGV